MEGNNSIKVFQVSVLNKFPTWGRFPNSRNVELKDDTTVSFKGGYMLFTTDKVGTIFCVSWRHNALLAQPQITPIIRDINTFFNGTKGFDPSNSQHNEVREKLATLIMDELMNMNVKIPDHDSDQKVELGITYDQIRNIMQPVLNIAEITSEVTQAQKQDLQQPKKKVLKSSASGIPNSEQEFNEQMSQYHNPYEQDEDVNPIMLQSTIFSSKAKTQSNEKGGDIGHSQ